ncbi:MAG: M20/M25/M40 family metallo-hydrolase, partial [Elusimicrobiota bacterium]
MNRYFLVAAMAVVLSVSSLSAAEPDFDQGVRVQPVLEQAREGSGVKSISPKQKGVPQADPDLWIVVSKPAASGLGASAGLGSSFGFDRRVALAANPVASLYQTKESEIGELTDLMHKRFGKCGGFFAFDSREKALAALSAPEGASAPGKYSVDQSDLVEPMVAAVQEEGVRGVIERLSAYKNRYYKSDTGAASARSIADQWKGLFPGRSDVSVELFSHAWAQPSVILTIQGSKNPEEIVVLGGHEDSISGWSGSDATAPGADDDASGIASLTEVLRVIAASGYRPGRTVKVMAYAAEEVGLRGSKEIAGAFKGRSVVGALQLDMTNYQGSSEDIYLIADHTDAAQNAFLGKLIDRYLSGVKWSQTKCGYA